MANEQARSLRRNMTDAERRLWYQLRGLKAEGYHFRKQAPIGRFIVDFVCFGGKLIIEVDGGQHNTDQGLLRDALRSQFLEGEGFKVLRFWNNEVLLNTVGVIRAILDELGCPD
jgi:very-short-patch-repair endonuclease